MLQRQGETPGGVVQIDEGADAHDFDISPPILVLTQPTSQRGSGPGLFLRKDTEEESATLEIVSLRVKATRTKWPEGGYRSDNKPECQSWDGVTGNKGSRYEGQSCLACPHYIRLPWEAPEGADVCKPDYIVLLMDAETYDLYVMRLAGTAARLARALRAKGNLRTTHLHLYSVKQQNERGTWYEPRVKVVDRLSEADRAMAVLQYEPFKAAELKVDEDMPTDVPDDDPLPFDPADSLVSQHDAAAVVEQAKDDMFGPPPGDVPF